MSMISAEDCAVGSVVEKYNTHITTDNRRVSHSMIDLLMKEEDYDAVVTSNIRFAEKIRHVVENFSLEQPIPIFTLSSVTSLPEQDYRKYELNYGLLGGLLQKTHCRKQ